jgi:hypothetical protein
MIYDSRLDFWERADNLFNKAIVSTANQRRIILGLPSTGYKCFRLDVPAFA